MSRDYPIGVDDETMALRLVGWVVADSGRAERLLTLTGLDPAELRASLTQPAMLSAIMDFVINHEPDLIACADALGVTPDKLVAARGRLGR